ACSQFLAAAAAEGYVARKRQVVQPDDTGKPLGRAVEVAVPRGYGEAPAATSEIEVTKTAGDAFATIRMADGIVRSTLHTAAEEFGLAIPMRIEPLGAENG